MSRYIEVQDRTEFQQQMKDALVIDPKKTVLLTVDMQREYLDMEIGGSPVAPEDAERVLKHAKALLLMRRGWRVKGYDAPAEGRLVGSYRYRLGEMV